MYHARTYYWDHGLTLESGNKLCACFNEGKVQRLGSEHLFTFIGECRLLELRLPDDNRQGSIALPVKDFHLVG